MPPRLIRPAVRSRQDKLTEILVLVVHSRFLGWRSLLAVRRTCQLGLQVVNGELAMVTLAPNDDGESANVQTHIELPPRLRRIVPAEWVHPHLGWRWTRRMRSVNIVDFFPETCDLCLLAPAFSKVKRLRIGGLHDEYTPYVPFAADELVLFLGGASDPDNPAGTEYPLDPESVAGNVALRRRRAKRGQYPPLSPRIKRIILNTRSLTCPWMFEKMFHLTKAGKLPGTVRELVVVVPLTSEIGRSYVVAWDEDFAVSRLKDFIADLKVKYTVVGVETVEVANYTAQIRDVLYRQLFQSVMQEFAGPEARHLTIPHRTQLTLATEAVDGIMDRVEFVSMKQYIESLGGPRHPKTLFTLSELLCIVQTTYGTNLDRDERKDFQNYPVFAIADYEDERPPNDFFQCIADESCSMFAIPTL